MSASSTVTSGDPFSPAPGKYCPPLQIGSTQVQIEKFVAEGGFARVYAGRKLSDGRPVAVKRKSLKHKNIVDFVDSQTSRASGGNVEILIAMEYCPGGPLVDLMNKRMNNRFTEPQILEIFSCVAEAVAHLHYKSPPVIHRDIKVENVLISSTGTFKLCDFGSCTTKIVPFGSALRATDISTIQDEIDRETTLQYRAPEMCDLYRRRGLTEKIDIWALGVLLYKLCYFTTPFEVDGKLAILNGRYEIPSQPPYSPQLREFIRKLLADDPRARPNIFRVIETVSNMLSIQCPIQNIYPSEEEDLAQGEAKIQPTGISFNKKHEEYQQRQRRSVQLSPPSNLRRGRVTKNQSSNTSPELNSSNVTQVIGPPTLLINEPRNIQTAFESNASFDDPFANIQSDEAVDLSVSEWGTADPFQVSEVAQELSQIEQQVKTIETQEEISEFANKSNRDVTTFHIIEDQSLVETGQNQLVQNNTSVAISSDLAQIADLNFDVTNSMNVPKNQESYKSFQRGYTNSNKPLPTVPIHPPIQTQQQPSMTFSMSPASASQSKNISHMSSPRSMSQYSSPVTSSPGGWSFSIVDPVKNKAKSQAASSNDPFASLVNNIRPNTAK